MRARGLILGAMGALCLAAAPDPSERLPDPAQEARARHLFKELRCVVCQNESIDDSDADLAGDLRRLVRDQVHAGRSDAEIRAYLVARYGEFVLLKPPMAGGALAFWVLPPLLLLGGGLWLLLQVRRPRLAPEPALSEDEERRLRVLTADPASGHGFAQERSHQDAQN